ncbi:hypothetical protein [Streptomyces sp. SP17KL33]|uniref:hypothetical protein n=1 Tax=Streptomyces sp. SP17KL33 TaxID=3002534 RepID=UPI002E7A32F7|nr:hypothetical protein [Streptomyces sp. SP17KL33]MEE1761369.1 hypothetical protein [Streptomyces sp. SP18BB07]MEE1836065.1 hypothetical protein [Streptomyces sp. SP17KL33]
MPEAPEEFDAAMATWQEWQDAPWGRLRYSIAEANLLRHLDDLAAHRCGYSTSPAATAETPSASRPAGTVSPSLTMRPPCSPRPPSEPWRKA